MAEIRKKIGNLPTYKGDYVNKVYNIYQQVSYLGATFQSKIDNNTSVPATLDANGDYIVNANWSMIARGVTDEKVNSVIDSKLEQPLHNIEVAEQGREAAEVIREQKIAEMANTYATKVELSNEMVGVVKDYKGVSFPLVTGDVNAVPILNLPKVKTPFSFCFNFVGVKTGEVTDNFFREHNGGIGNFLIRASINTLGVGLFNTWVNSNTPYNYGNTSVVVSHDGDTTAKCWINGVEYSAQIPFIESGAIIKMYNAAIASEIRTFNYALTQSDVDMLYNQGRWGDVKLGSEWRQNINIIPSISVWNTNNWSLLNIDDFKRCTQKDNAIEYYGGCSILPLTTEIRNIPLKVSFSIRSVGSLQQVFVGSDNGEEKKIPVNITSDFVNHSVVWMSDNSGNVLAVGLTGDIGSGNGFDIKDIVVENAQLLDEFLPENLSPTEWKNTGLNTTPIALTNPQFTFDAPFKEKTFGNGAPTAIPEAALIEYSDIATGNIYKAGAKPNTRQFAVSDWKRINN